MRDISSLTAKTLLSIHSPERLFSNSLPQAKQEYRTLACQWHPDRRKEEFAPAVFAHIVQLYRLAQTKLLDGSWDEPCEKIEAETPGIVKFRDSDNGSVRSIECLSVRRFELGVMYVGSHSVAFEVRREFDDLFRNGRRAIHSLLFPDREMAAEMSRCLPEIIGSFNTAFSKVLVLRKTPDQILLADIISHYGGKVEPFEHAGWILNVLLNIACYLQWSGLSHNAIGPETFFVSPLRHSGMLLGGWWYATKEGQALTAVPDRSLGFIPPDIIADKRANARADLELIRLTGRELLGDASGFHLTFDSAAPPALVDWLQLPSAGSAVEDYQTFKHRVLPKCFGAPRFIDMKLEGKDIYKEN
jgi:hypothetical protein